MNQAEHNQSHTKKKRKKEERVIEVGDDDLEFFVFENLDQSLLPPSLPYYFEQHNKYRFVRVQQDNIRLKSGTEDMVIGDAKDLSELVSLYKKVGIDTPIHFIPLAKFGQETDPESGEKRPIFTLDYGENYFKAWREAFPTEAFLVVVSSREPL